VFVLSFASLAKDSLVGRALIALFFLLRQKDSNKEKGDFFPKILLIVNGSMG